MYMTWTALTIVGVIALILTSPTSDFCGWFIDKFALHPKLDSKVVTVTFNANKLEGNKKNRFIDHFNEAVFLKRFDIFAGNEKFFLEPETNVIPVVINFKNRKKEVNFFLYIDDKDIMVVKQRKKKVDCYSLDSENLQNFIITI